MKIRFTDVASADLRRIHQHIAVERPIAAGRVIRRIRASVEGLREHPEIGRAAARRGTRELAVRGLPYIIIYEIDDVMRDLTILRILHGAQNRD